MRLGRRLRKVQKRSKKKSRTGKKEAEVKKKVVENTRKRKVILKHVVDNSVLPRQLPLCSSGG